MTDTPMADRPTAATAGSSRARTPIEAAMTEAATEVPMTGEQHDDGRRPPLYARVLRLKHVRPSGILCFLYFEGAVALAVLLALAELVPWWTVLVLPAVVAVMVKLNDVLAGLLGARPAATRPSVPGGGGSRVRVIPQREVRHVSRDLSDTMDPVDSPRQRFRQSARRRYR